MQFESDPAFFSRFQREESIGRKLKHPYILRIVPVEDKSRPYIAMEFLKGQTLRSVMQSCRADAGQGRPGDRQRGSARPWSTCTRRK